MKDSEYLSKTLITVGGGLAIFAGGCGILFVLETPGFLQVGTTLRGEPFGIHIPSAAAMIGGIPCLIGTALYLWGKKIRKRLAEKKEETKTP